MKKAIRTLLLLAVAAVFIIPSITPAFINSENGTAVQADAASGKWVGAWATAPISATVSVGSAIEVQDIILARSTTRTELTVTTGGTLVRILVSNLYGEDDLEIDQASIAKTNTEVAGAILENTSVALTFNGSPSVSVDKGKEIWSDPVYYVTETLDKLSVSFYYSSRSRMSTCGLFGGKTYLSTAPVSALLGNASQVNNLTLNNPGEVSIGSSTITYHTIPFLMNVDVFTPDIDAYTTVIIGDSTLTNNNHIFLATKLANAGVTNIGFINQSIVANRLLYDGVGLIGSLYGPAFIDRFERDALNQSNVKVILMKIGLNDILHPATKSMSGKAPYASVDDIISGYKSVIDMAHKRGIKIYMFKMTAWKGYQRSFLGQSDDLTWSQELQDMCDALDRWAASTPLLDGFINLDTLDDPLDDNALLPAFTTDGAHLTDLGAIGCADSIPLSIFSVYRDVKSVADIIGVDIEQAKKDRVDAANAAAQTTVAPETQAPATQAPATQAPDTQTPSTEATTLAGEQEVTTRQNNVTPVQVQTTAVPAAEVEDDTTVVTEDTTVEAPTVDAPTQAQAATQAPVIPSAGDADPAVDSVNNGAKIGLVLVIVLVLVVAGTIVVLSLGRKKVDGEV